MQWERNSQKRGFHRRGLSRDLVLCTCILSFYFASLKSLRAMPFASTATLPSPGICCSSPPPGAQRLCVRFSLTLRRRHSPPPAAAPPPVCPGSFDRCGEAIRAIRAARRSAASVDSCLRRKLDLSAPVNTVDRSYHLIHLSVVPTVRVNCRHLRLNCTGCWYRHLFFRTWLSNLLNLTQTSCAPSVHNVNEVNLCF